MGARGVITIQKIVTVSQCALHIVCVGLQTDVRFGGYKRKIAQHVRLILRNVENELQCQWFIVVFAPQGKCVDCSIELDNRERKTAHV